jgi:DNA-directed RNA polymerase subunit M/transcription elongation factor TFIIS
MEFCAKCGHHMRKEAQSDARIIFQCTACGNVQEASATDTLWLEHASVREDTRYEMLVERAAYDFAGKTVLFACKDCPLKRQYVTMVQHGENATITYVCECGAQYDHQMKKIAK